MNNSRVLFIAACIALTSWSALSIWRENKIHELWNLERSRQDQLREYMKDPSKKIELKKVYFTAADLFPFKVKPLPFHGFFLLITGVLFSSAHFLHKRNLAPPNQSLKLTV